MKGAVGERNERATTSMGVKTVRACQHGGKIGKMWFFGLTILLHGWPDTKSLTIDISSPRPHHIGRTVSREQHCMMDFNKPEMNFSFPSLCIRKLSVLDARLPSLGNSKMGQLQMRTEHTKSEQCLSRRATSHMAQHQRLKRSGCGSRSKISLVWHVSDSGLPTWWEEGV